MLGHRSLSCIIILLVATAGIGGASSGAPAPTAHAQLGGGNSVVITRVSDGATVAWSARSGDGTREFWAYVQGEFEFASSSHTAANPWRLHGVYDSSIPTGGFEAFRTEVLSRAAAQNKTIIFHNMTVAESVTQN